MKKMVVWPVNLAAGRTRSEGRIVPLRLGLKSPKLEEIEEVARALNLEPIVEQGKAYPKTHWNKTGRVLVNKTGKKGVVIRAIAEGIKELRVKAKEKEKVKTTTRAKEKAKKVKHGRR